jgi:alkylation response protein AidB-like acyl-CoA dehydrogenase
LTFDPQMALAAMLDTDHPRKDAARQWASEHLRGVDEGFDRALWQRAAEWGVQGLMTDPRYGGSGCSSVETLLVFEGLALGVADDGFVFALASQVFAMQRALERFGSEDQKQRWLPPLCAGTAIGAFAMTEAGAGSDTTHLATTATPLGDGRYRLDGAKTWITLAPDCDVIIVFATVDPSKGRWGTTAFIVPADLPGIVRGPSIPKMGMRSCPFGTIGFDGCEVGPETLLGAAGAGANVFNDAVQAERAFLYAAQLGSMERVLDRCIARARERVQGGQTIGTFQAVSHRIVEMKRRHETARLLVYKAAALYDRGDSLTLAASLAKLHTSEVSVQSAVDAVQLHGAEGYTVEAGLEASLRDAVGGLAYSGTSDVQRNIIARLLGVDRPARRPHQPVPLPTEPDPQKVSPTS